MTCTWILVLCVVVTAIAYNPDFPEFDDTILFAINWPGSKENIENLIDGKVPDTKIVNQLAVVTADQEEYECHLPDVKNNKSMRIEDYNGPSPLNLLKPLFAQKICSYRLESYWNYEVCHGRYVRQYHEEREGKSTKVQEFYLGHWSVERELKLEAEVHAAQEAKVPLKTTKVEGMSMPYVGMVMDEGTLCDLSGKPRQTRLLYVCYSHGKHEVYSFKEVSTCEYEIIILSPLLCEHPQFRPKEVSENPINCYALGDSPKKPRSALQMEVESLKSQHQSIRMINTGNDMDAKDIIAVLKVEKIEKDGETQLKFEIHPLQDESVKQITAEDNAEDPKALDTDVSKADTDVSKADTDVSNNPGSNDDVNKLAVTDDSPIRAFLGGDNCLHGSGSWWKYEFCYGKHVTQYHIDRDGAKISVLLGQFDEEAHLKWVDGLRAKTTHDSLFSPNSISHFYSNGDLCDKTGKPRQTEVKLKCLENSSNSAQVSLYLLEPRTCNYILGVESPQICDLLPLADKNGLIKNADALLRDNKPKVKRSDDKTEKTEKVVIKFGND